MASQTDAGRIEGTSEYQDLPPSPTAIQSRSKRDTNAYPFVERHHLKVDELEYKRDGKNPGKIVIFNNEFFDQKEKYPTRFGTQRDVNEIVMCFQRLGFNVYDDDIHHDLTVSEISKTLDAVLENKDELLQSNSLIMFFLTHGEADNQLVAKDGLFDGSTIWTKFNSCKQLEHKPKMFVFQACKGRCYNTIDGKEAIDNINEEPAKLLQISSFTANQLGIDMLLVYSTLEGTVSFRNPQSGTWFIQELCKNFLAYGRRDDVFSLLTRLNKCVCGNYFDLVPYTSVLGADYKKQMPIFVSTLSKKFYLNRNKDRHTLIDISEKTDEIYEMVKELTERIPKLRTPKRDK